MNNAVSSMEKSASSIKKIVSSIKSKICDFIDERKKSNYFLG